MNISFALKEVARSISRDPIPTTAAIASVVVTMLVLGVVIPIASVGSGVANATKQRVYVAVFVSPKSSKADAAQIASELRATRLVRQVELVDRGGALADLQRSDPDAFALIGDSNPIPTTLRVFPRETDDLAALARYLVSYADSHPAVDEVKNAQLSDTLVRTMNAVRLGSAGLVILLLGATVLLIGNTIRLSLYARRREVEVMKLVGATDWFVRWPFLLEGLLVGVLGGVVAIAILLVTGQGLLQPVTSLPIFQGLDVISGIGLAVAILVGSIAVSALGTLLSLRRFLNV